MQKPRFYHVYLVSISLLGSFLVIWGLLQFPDYQRPVNFILILILAAVSEFATTSVSVTRKAGITYDVGTAVSMAAIPFFGPAAAATATAAASLSVWLIKPADNNTWKKSWAQLAFNTGMHSVSIFLAGCTFLLLKTWVGGDTLWAQIIPWLPAAIVYDQANFWLIMAIFRLQNGSEIEPTKIWRENLWAASINILLLSVGGGILAFAVERLDWIGIVIFFLPIVLSAYAFRLYVHQMQEHMNNLEEIVAERTKELADLNREKDAFLAVLTHDMKSPLTTISLCAGMIEHQPTIAQQKPHLVEMILRNQRTLLDIVNNILDLENLQTGGALPLKKEAFNLAELVEETVEGIKTQAAEKAIYLEHQIKSEVIPVQADRQQIERVLQNLVSNAVKYTGRDGHVQVKARTENGQAIIDVEDTGYGIPEEELPHIFDRFRRVEKNKDKAVGTGLGLAITKAIVEAHDGNISVVSKEGEGSTFSFRLPV